jgi:DnaJ-class molecular chaperone
MNDEPKTIPCPDCGGTGKQPIPLNNLPGPVAPEQMMIECPTCGGTGEVRKDRP